MECNDRFYHDAWKVHMDGRTNCLNTLVHIAGCEKGSVVRRRLGDEMVTGV